MVVDFAQAIQKNFDLDPSHQYLKVPCSYDRELRDDVHLTLWKDRDGQRSREARFDII